VRAWTTALVTAGLSLTLAACGSSGDDPGTAATDPTPSDEPSQASQWEPTRDISWIVPYSPGGGFDIYARGVAQAMKDGGFLPDGVNVVIRNTTPLPQGLTELYTAKPDGYTVGILPMPGAISMQIQQPDIARWDAEKYEVLGEVDENGYVVYVAASSPYQTVDDLIGKAGLRSLAVDPASNAGLAGQATVAALGLDATTTYGLEGSADAVTGLLRGDADFIVYGTTDLVEFVESGDIRPILFLGTEDQRPANLEWLTDVPSAQSAGYPDLAGAVTELRIIAAPPGLPDDVAAYWKKLVYDTITSDTFTSWAETAERQVVARDADDAKTVVDEQIERMKVLVPQLSSEG